MSFTPTEDTIHIREVWSDNLDHEFKLIRDIIDTYSYVAMDTEFPGIVVKRIGDFRDRSVEDYENLRANVDSLKLIQLGLTFSNKNGTLPTCGTDKHCIWQFNFREFNREKDQYAHDSIELLVKSGIDFNKNIEKGIDAKHFGELLMSSGVVVNSNVKWVVFQGSYDFGYLVKVLTCSNLPDTLEGFMTLVETYFGNFFDVKCLMGAHNLHGGLSGIARQLQVERVGTTHQAGSDSLLTWCVFAKLKRDFFNGVVEDHGGVLYWPP